MLDDFSIPVHCRHSGWLSSGSSWTIWVSLNLCALSRDIKIHVVTVVSSQKLAYTSGREVPRDCSLASGLRNKIFSLQVDDIAIVFFFFVVLGARSPCYRARKPSKNLVQRTICYTHNGVVLCATRDSRFFLSILCDRNCRKKFGSPSLQRAITESFVYSRENFPKIHEGMRREINKNR